MTELEQTLLQALRALDTEHESALHRMKAMSQNIEQQQEQITQLATSLLDSVNLQNLLEKRLSDLENLLRKNGRA